MLAHRLQVECGNVQVDKETVINPKVAELGKPVWRVEDIPTPDPDAPALTAAKRIEPRFPDACVQLVYVFSVLAEQGGLASAWLATATSSSPGGRSPTWRC